MTVNFAPAVKRAKIWKRTTCDTSDTIHAILSKARHFGYLPTDTIHAILSKARHFGYLPTDFHPLDDLPDASDESLFMSTRYNPQHVLHQILPPPKQITYNLRSRGHGLTLSAIPSEFMRKNFLYRMLYNVIY